MSSLNSCPGLINSSYNDNNNAYAPLRIAVIDGCHLTRVIYLNYIIKALKRSYFLTYCHSYGEVVNGEWNGIIGELVSNRSDFSPNPTAITYERYRAIDYSPSFRFGNALTILSRKLLANNGNGFSILNSFSIYVWLIFCFMLIVIAITKNSLHKELNLNYSLLKSVLVDVLGDFINYWALFINKSINFGDICCFKHLILNSVTVISIFLMSLFFNSEILSNLLFHPLLKIDTLDDLVEFVTQHGDVKLISDRISTSWSIMKHWDDERAKLIFPRMTSVPISKFDYKQVYYGKSIIITFDAVLQGLVTSNKHLKFHISSDRLFWNQYGFIYSKNIDINTKRVINYIISSVFESGIHSHIEERELSKRLDIRENENTISISFSYFKKIIVIHTYLVILLILILIFEIIFNKYFMKQKNLVGIYLVNS